MATQFLHRNLIRITILMYVILLIFLAFTNPSKLPIYVIIVPIVWLFVCMSFTAHLLIGKFQKDKDTHKRRNLIYSAGFSGLICTVILLRSVDQLNSKDVLLVVIFLAVASFYAGKLRISTKTTN
jgi:FlaA1/EpsC-like NDP-sugar epimerase